MAKSKCLASTAGIIVLLALAPAAIAGPGKKIAEKSASGEFAFATAQGGAKKPKNLTVRVSADPIQTVIGSYGLFCNRGPFKFDYTDANFNQTSPYERTLKPNVRNAKRCKLYVDANLDQSGEITIELFAKRR